MPQGWTQDLRRSPTHHKAKTQATQPAVSQYRYTQAYTGLLDYPRTTQARFLLQDALHHETFV